MNLPFLTNKKNSGIAATIIQNRKPDGGFDPKDESQDSDSAGLEAAAQDILNAIKSGDAKALASAIKSAFEICDASPHVEGEHIESSEE